MKDSKLHVAIVSPFRVEKPKGGVESAALNLVRELVRDGAYQVTVLAPSYKGLNHSEQCDGYVLQWVAQPSPGFLTYWSVWRARVHKHLRALNPDITHFQALLALSYGYKGAHVATVHGIGEADIRARGGRLAEVRAKIVGWAERRARMHLQDCIVINPYVAELLGDQLVRANRHTIGNPLNPSFFEEAENPVARENDILFVAKMDRNKNLGAALDAFAQARDQLPEDTKLIVYGPVADPHYHTQCEVKIGQLALQDRVTFKGSQPPAIIAEHMRRARALLLTSQHEVAPMVISESLSCGLPTVTFRKCGMQYMLEDGVTGALAADGDVQGLAQGLVTVFEREDMAQNCRRAGEAYSPQRVMQQTTDLYRQIIAAQ